MATSLDLIGIELQLRGEEEVYAAVNEIDNKMKSVEGRHVVELELGKASKRIDELTGKINGLKRARDEATDKDTAKSYSNQLKQTQRDLDDVRLGQKLLNSAVKETAKAEREMAKEAAKAQKEAQKSIKTFGQYYKEISTGAKHTGQNLQTLGNTLTRFARPFQTIATGALVGFGYKALGTITSGLESGFARYDTMNKYTRLMKEYEKANYSAEQSRKELDESVQGLPIALDDAISLAQRYTLSLGDMEEGTKLAIATNNAFLASMATEQQRYQGMLQMQDLLNGKDLNSREWMSLGASMGKAINEIGKEFGYTNENMGKFREELYAGHISTEAFLKALKKVGTGNGSLVELAKQSMDTWEAFFSRINTAFSRVGYKTILALDDLVNTVTGGKFKSMNSFLDKLVIPNIDKFGDSVSKWIKAHPEEITDFFKKLGGVDWKGLALGFAEGMKIYLDVIAQIGNSFGGIGLRWVGKWMAWAGIIGKGVTMIGGLMKGLSHPIGFLGALLFSGKTIKGGLFGRLLTNLFGKKGMTEVPVAPSALDTLKSVFDKLKGVLTVAGTVAVISGTTAFASWSIKSALTNIKEIISLISEIGWEDGAKAAAGMAGFFTAMSGIGYALGTPTGAGVGAKALVGTAIGGSITSLISLFTMGDMMMLKKAVTDFRDMVQAMSDIGTMLKDFNLSDLTDSIGTVTQITSAMNQIREALMGSTVKGQETIGIKALPLGTKNGIKDVAEAIDLLVGAVTSINSLNSAEINIDNVSENAGALSEALGEIGGLMEELPSIFYQQWASKLSGEVLSTVNNFDAFLGGMKSVLAKMQELWAIIDTQAENPILLAPIKTRLGNIFKDFSDIIKSYDDAKIGNTSVLVTKMQNFATAFESIKQIMTRLKQMEAIKLETAGKNGTGLFKGMQMVNKLIGELQTSFNAEKLGTINSQIQGFVDTVNGMLDTFDRLGNGMGADGGINIKIEVSDKVTGLSKVVSDIHNIDRKVRAAIRSIKTDYHKTITLNINGKVNESGMGKFRTYDSSVSGGNHQSRGGYTSRHGVLYRSGGGSVFRPRGTDKIPAMLTEGEYVHRKQAVDAFGIDFMRKVNNLDIRGAMNALLARGGMSASIGRQSIINNTVNNNQRVTQNINTNNPQFARIRASRFAGAL